jgi:hypothetical protein
MGTTINAQTKDSEYVRAVYRWEELIIIVFVLQNCNSLFPLEFLFNIFLPSTLSCLCRIGQVIVQQFQQPWLEIPWIFSVSALGREHNRLLKILHGFTEDVCLDLTSLKNLQIIKLNVFSR